MRGCAGGLYEADLGGGLLKKRIARPGQGKSGGYRTLVATNKRGRWFFVFGFPKDVRSNIDEDEEEALKKLAPHLLFLPPPALITAQRAGEEQSRVSQAIFAALLNTSVSTVQKWEIGQKRPTGTALKLLHLVRERGLEIIA